MSALSYQRMIQKKPWYESYKSAKRRCNDRNHKSFPWYGGKGIKFFLHKWEVEILWLRDMGPMIHKPRLERKDPLGNYCFENCEFISAEENQRRRNIKEELAPAEWTD